MAGTNHKTSPHIWNHFTSNKASLLWSFFLSRLPFKLLINFILLSSEKTIFDLWGKSQFWWTWAYFNLDVLCLNNRHSYRSSRSQWTSNHTASDGHNRNELVVIGLSWLSLLDFCFEVEVYRTLVIKSFYDPHNGAVINIQFWANCLFDKPSSSRVVNEYH